MSAAALTRGALLSIILLFSVASPATAADDDASISHVEATKGGVKILVSVPQGAEVDLDSVAVLAGTSSNVLNWIVLL